MDNELCRLAPRAADLCRQAGKNGVAAGDFLTRIPGGLSGEIVGVGVEDHAPTHDFFYRKPIGDEGPEGVSIRAEERRHIPRVVGMGTSQGIVVHTHIGERIAGTAGACAAFVDVQSENGTFARARTDGQADHLGHHQHAVSAFIKADRPPQGGIILASAQDRPGGGIPHRTSAAGGKGLILIHKTPRKCIYDQYMRRGAIGAFLPPPRIELRGIVCYNEEKREK